MTEEEKREIREIVREIVRDAVPQLIDQKIMDFALKLPLTISNLVLEATAKTKLFMELSSKNKEMSKDNIGMMVKTYMEVDKENPGKTPSEILELAQPIIKERLGIISKLDFNKPIKPTDLKFRGDMGSL